MLATAGACRWPAGRGGETASPAAVPAPAVVPAAGQVHAAPPVSVAATVGAVTSAAAVLITTHRREREHAAAFAALANARGGPTWTVTARPNIVWGSRRPTTP